ncbi:hypothetical protein ACSBR1_027839 [Camellia fascicularis]
MSDYYIPLVLLIDILTRLPAETLVRSTLVCKSWYSLITSPSFISHHLNRTISNPNNTRLLLRYCTEEPNERGHYSVRCDDPINNTFNEYAKFKFPFHCIDPCYCIVGSCNGLICISDDQLYYKNTTFLWNPLIRKSMLIPNPNIRFTSHGPFTHSLGFGFDSASNDFKVVRIVYLLRECDTVPPEVEIYTLKTGIWRSISDKALPYIIEDQSPQAYINGVSHWVAHTPRDVGIFRNLIVSFDMKDEVFREVSFPDGIAGKDEFLRTTSLVVFEETLCLIQRRQYQNDSHCWIWVMKEYGVVASWVRQFRFDLHGVLRKPIGMRKNGEVLLVTSEGYLVSYDPESKRIVNLGVRGTTKCQYWDAFYLDTYMESLVLLDKGADFCDTVIINLLCEESEGD